MCMHYKTRENAFVGSSWDGLDDPMSSPIKMDGDVFSLNIY